MLIITFTGKLINVFETPARGDNPQRHSLQLLSEVVEGDPQGKAEMRDFKLPKGTNPHQYYDKVGKVFKIRLEEWSSSTGHGFFIRDVRDIQLSDVNKNIKAAS